MARIIVLGAGICGLGTALLLARDGHDVTVLERDDGPLPDSPDEAWSGWARKGVAQFRQPHNFMPGLRLMLEAELPDVQDALRRAGAAKFDLLNPMPPFWTDRAPRAVDEKLWTYTARRPVGEWVFARAALEEPGITIRRGTRAAELLTGATALANVPHVVGVRTDAGETLDADLVVDATGRLSKSPAWLAAIGARAPREEQADCGFRYYTRFFHGIPPEPKISPLTNLGTISLLTLPGDNDTWSVTIFTASGDKALAALRRADKWAAVIRACPLHAHWLDGEPLTDVLALSGIVDRYRRFVVDGSPVATGFVAIADAWACTNPSAGRGLTVGMLQGRRLRDALRETLDRPDALAARFDEVTEAELAPWYHAQLAVDGARFAEMEALRDGREPPGPADELAAQCASLLAAMPADPDVFRAGLEYIGTITPVQDLYRRPELAGRVAAALAGLRAAGPAQMPGPDRRQLLAIAS